MMMEPTPAAPFEVIQPQLVLEFLVVALDPPPQLSQADESGERDGLRQRRQPVLRRRRVAARPLDEEPFRGARRRPIPIAMGGPHAQPPCPPPATAGAGGRPAACGARVWSRPLCHLGWNAPASGTPPARRRRRSWAQLSGR